MSAAAIIAWIVRGGWRWIAGAAAALAIGWLGWAVWDAGYQDAERKCDAAAARAEADKLRLERDAAHAAAARASATAAELQVQDQAARERQRDLESEIGALRNAARPGGGGLLTDRCDLTDRGVRFFSR